MYRHKTIVRATAALAIAIATVGLLLLRKPVPSAGTTASRSSDLVLSFYGFTNLNGSAAAIFICTNDTRHPLALDLRGIEYRTNGVWQSATGLPTVASIPTRSMGMFPKSSAAWIVPVHTTNLPWRLRILCVEPATGVDGAVDKATDAVKSLAKNGRLGIYTTYEGRNYEVVASSELTK